MDKEVHLEEGDILNKYLANNRIEHLADQMALHPAYLKAFQKSQQFLMAGDGPLPVTYRHYIAIMAAGRHQCEYLIQSESLAFQMHGGEESWLTAGLTAAPAKLSRLYTLNKLLAHRPWLITRHHIEELTRSKQASWSLSELMQAIAILAQYHALSSFIFSCGINTGKNDQCLSSLLQRLRQLGEKKETEFSEEELLKRFNYIENQDMEFPMNNPPTVNSSLSSHRFQQDAGYTYEDFAKRSTSSPRIQTFRARDYSWQDHGYGAANRLYPDIGNVLDDKFKTITSLTYHTMGDSSNVDTSAFRQAIWYYIHCLFGIRHDDYDYQQVNVFLERPLKNYIKTVTCFPERSDSNLVKNMPAFAHSEKVHIDLMIVEARFQASLLYGLRALMNYHNHQ